MGEELQKAPELEINGARLTVLSNSANEIQVTFPDRKVGFLANDVRSAARAIGALLNASSKPEFDPALTQEILFKCPGVSEVSGTVTGELGPEQPLSLDPKINETLRSIVQQTRETDIERLMITELPGPRGTEFFLPPLSLETQEAVSIEEQIRRILSATSATDIKAAETEGDSRAFPPAVKPMEVKEIEAVESVGDWR